MPTKRTLTRQLNEARAARDLALEQRDDARDERDAAVGNQRRLARQLDELREELDALRKQQAPPPATPAPAGSREELTVLRRALALRERACRHLDAQLVQLGQINDRMCREAYDRAEAAR